MIFKVIYIVAKEKREKIINSDSLEDAVEKANKISKNWVDIYINDFKRGDNFKKSKGDNLNVRS